MAIRVFLDANVLLDFTLKREQYQESKQIMELVINGRIYAHITSSVLHITAYWLTKAYNATTAKEILLSLLTDVTVIDISRETAVVALHSKMTDIEDCLQYYTAIEHKLDYFVTNDKKLKKDGIPLLPVIPPNQLIKEIAD